MKKALQFLLLVIILPTAIYSGIVLINESRLREFYNERVVMIPEKAKTQIASGTSLESGVRWAIDERNQAKIDVREMGNPITKRLAELRNIKKYQNPVGPDYDFLMSVVKKEGDTTADVHYKIIKGSGRTNKNVNSNAYSREQMGWGLASLAMIIAAFYAFASANITHGIVRETARLATALLGGRMGVWLGVWVSQITAAEEHTIAAGVIGGIIGSITLSLTATSIIHTRYNHTSSLEEKELVNDEPVLA